MKRLAILLMLILPSVVAAQTQQDAAAALALAHAARDSGDTVRLSMIAAEADAGFWYDECQIVLTDIQNDPYAVGVYNDGCDNLANANDLQYNYGGIFYNGDNALLYAEYYYDVGDWYWCVNASLSALQNYTTGTNYFQAAGEDYDDAAARFETAYDAVTD